MNELKKKWKLKGKKNIFMILLSVMMIFAVFPITIFAAGEPVELTGLSVPTYATTTVNTAELSVQGQYKVNDINGADGAILTVRLTPNDATYVAADGNTYHNGLKYFSEVPIQVTGAADLDYSMATSVIDSVTGIITVTIPFKEGIVVNSQGNFTLTFPFNDTEFDAYVANGTNMGNVYMSIEKNSVISEKEADIISSSSISVYWGGNNGIAPVEALLDETIVQSHNMPKITATSNSRLEPGSMVTVVTRFPVGATVVNNGGGVVDPVAGTITWTLGPVPQSGLLSPAGGDGIFSQEKGSTFVFPSASFESGEVVSINHEVYYTPWGTTETRSSTYTRDITLQSIGTNPHLESFSRNNLSNSDTVAYVNTPESVTSQHRWEIGNGVINNQGSPIPNMVFTWNNASDYRKARVNGIQFIVAENVDIKYKVVSYINDATGNLLSTTTNYCEDSEALSLDLLYDAISGEYIDHIEVWPLDNPNDSLTDLKNGVATEILALPAEATTLQIGINYRSWPSGKFPNGTTIENADVSQISSSLRWSDEYLPENFETIDTDNDPNTITWELPEETGPLQNVVYFKNAPQMRSAITILNSGNHVPGDVLNATLTIRNLNGLDNWENPVIYIMPPIITTLNREDTVVRDNLGTEVGTVTIDGPMTIGAYNNVYKVTLPEMSLASAAGGYTIPLSYTINEGTPVGTYNLATNNANPSTYPSLSGRVISSSSEEYNLPITPWTTGLPNSTWISDTALNDLDNNSNTIYQNSSNSLALGYASPNSSFSVIAENSLVPDAQMYNAEEGEWQLLTNPDAHSTVPLEGTGQVKLTVSNKGNSYIGGIRLLDILPYVGDTQVLSPYDARNSQWDALLNAEPMVKITDGEGNDKTADFTYNFRYSSLSDPTYNTGGISRTGTGTFSNNATAATAKSFDFSLVERLPAGYTIEILLTIKAPAEADENQIDDVAYNSFVVNGNFYSTATGGSAIQNGVPFEPGNQEFILTEIPTASITNLDGRVFKDLNNNDVYDVGVDIPYMGLPVEIYMWDTVNNEVTGEAIKTVTTQADGSYLFEALYSGTYVTRVIKPTGEAYQYATQGVKSDTLASHVDSNGYGYPVTVNPGGLTKLNENAGIQAIGSVTVRYKEGSTQIGSDVKTSIPFTSDTMSGSILAGSTTYPIPAGYHLVTSETASKNYSLGWGGTTNQVIEYQIEKDTYSVSYSYTNSPVGAPTLPTTQAVAWGESVIVAADPTMPGYTFSGWTTTDVIFPLTKALNFTMPQKNVTFSGTWILLNYDITYDYAGGEAPVVANPTEYTVEDTFPLGINNEPTRLGYTFLGWIVNYENTAISDTTTPIKGYSIPSGTTGNIKLTAVWKEIPLTSTYITEHYLQQTDGSYKLVESEELEESIGTTVEAVKKQYEGYTFNENISGSLLTGIVNEDGNLVLKVYYTKDQKITMTPSVSDGKEGTASVNTGIVSSDSLWILIMIGALGIMFVSKKRKQKRAD